MFHSYIEEVQNTLSMSLKVVRMCDWLLDLYVLDFFLDDHWNKLPKCWQDIFENLDPQKLGEILSGRHISDTVLPLSFMSLIKTVEVLSLPRKVKSNFETIESRLDNNSCAGHPRLKNLFLKHVKLKKRHEISLMAEVVNKTAAKCECKSIIDFGSGLGHLVRMLAYKNELKAAGIECQNQLTQEARKLDNELEYTASKHLSTEAISKLVKPLHFNLTLKSHEQLSEIPLPDSMKTYGLVGLHPCGDLGPLLIKHFVNCKNVKFICVVGCCYMKLTEDGYPMSCFLRKVDSELSYVSREIACHAIEVYCERLRKGTYEDLKVHAYRAALERLLVEQDPKLKHAPVRSIKHTDGMDFKKYCEMATEKLNIPLPTSSHEWTQGEDDLRQWRRVVTLYSLRLALAPLVETVILLDRMLYILENGLSCEIRTVFDPKLSPRNHIIVGERLSYI